MKLTWTKEGGYDGSNVIRYRANRGNVFISRYRHKGAWGLPAVYQNDRFVCGFAKLADAKRFAETLIN